MVSRPQAPERREGDPGPAREEALRILVRVSEEGAWASRLLEALDERSLDPRDIALTHEIVLGVLRWRGALDARIAALSHRKIERLEPAVREAFRIGAYQLLFLDRVPAHAAVSGSVALARRASGRGAAGLVNAVLRKLSREAAEGRAQPEESSPPSRTRGRSFEGARSLAARLAEELSHPEWFVARALARLGEKETRAFLLANNQPAPLTLRPNLLHPVAPRLAEALEEEGVITAPGKLAPGALVTVAGRPLRTRLFDEGAFWVQDEASQVIPLLFPTPWTGLTADLCAAPGGKSLVLATAGARVVAFDLHEHRVVRLARAAARIAPGRITAISGDLAAAPPVAESAFDRVLVDAPCSGTGVLRRHPEIRWRLTVDALAPLAALQAALLDAAFAMLRPGGWLVYSVCSTEPEETDGVLDAFLARSSCRIVDPSPHLPDQARAAIGQDRRLRTFPHRHGTDGFFAALLQKP